MTVGDRRQRRRRRRAGRHAQILQQAEARRAPLVEFDPDRHQPVAGVELGEIGVDVAERRDADRRPTGLGRDAEIGRDLPACGAMRSSGRSSSAVEIGFSMIGIARISLAIWFAVSLMTVDVGARDRSATGRAGRCP